MSSLRGTGRGTVGLPARAPGIGGTSYTNPVAMASSGWRDCSSGSVRQCANLTFGFMTLFLCSKCHEKCQAEAEAGEGPIKEAGGVPRGSGQGGALRPSPPPGSPLGLLIVCLGPALCPQSVPASHCDLVEMLPFICLLPGPRWDRLRDLPAASPPSLGSRWISLCSAG